GGLDRAVDHVPDRDQHDHRARHPGELDGAAVAQPGEPLDQLRVEQPVGGEQPEHRGGEGHVEHRVDRHQRPGPPAGPV
ncbi:hypothetical protein ADS78_13015, partial [Idiomarina abyssalis]